ncbi:Uncharacterised protein [Vibrio cholerae]|nr:Uncharacterised protein [Vibrio cholerae]
MKYQHWYFQTPQKYQTTDHFPLMHLRQSKSSHQWSQRLKTQSATRDRVLYRVHFHEYQALH